MKTILIAALIAASLTACVKSDGPKPASDIVAVTDGGSRIRKICVDSVSYLAFAGEVLIVQVDLNGRPVKCELPPKGGYSE